MIIIPDYYRRNRFKTCDPGVSLHMICKNEESELGEFIESIRGVWDEWIVVDTGSTDKSNEMLEAAGAKIVTYKHWDDTPGSFLKSFGGARNEALEHCTKEWVIWADFDDRFPKDSRKAVESLMDSGLDCFDWSIKYGTSVFPHLRMWRNGTNVQWLFPIHEVPKVDHLPLRKYINQFVIEHQIRDHKDHNRVARNVFRCRQHVLEDPTNPRPYFYLGNAAREAMGHFPDCINEAKRAYEIYREIRNPKDYPDEYHMASFFLGHLYLLEKRLDDAERMCWDAISANDQYGEAFRLLVDVRRTKGDKEGARRAMRLHKQVSKPKNATLFVTDQFYVRNDVILARPGALGDILMCSVACEQAKRKGDSVVFVTSQQVAPMMRQHPWVDELMIMEHDHDYPPESRICSYPIHNGYPTSKDAARDMFYRGQQYDCPMHLCQHFCESVGMPIPKQFKITCPNLWQQEEKLGIQIASTFRNFVTIQTETGWSVNKTWRDDRWEAVVKYLISNGYKVIQFGVNSKQIDGTVYLNGKEYDIRSQFGVLQRARMHIGLDSVFNHAANGYDTPAVILFGSTAPHSSGYPNAINIFHGRRASGGDGRCPCAPCWRELEDVCEFPYNRKCTEEISVDEVIRACEKQLKDSQ